MSEKEAATRAKELEVWDAWRENRTNPNLKKVLKVLKPTIESNVSKFSTGNLPKSALRAKMTNLTVGYLDGFDPERGVKLNTYIENTAGRKLHRYVYEHQNIGKIPENRIVRIGTYRNVKSNMDDALGRAATSQELADELGWDIKQLKLLEKEMRSDLVQDMVSYGYDSHDDSEVDDYLDLLHAELSGTDKDVMEYLYGLHGKQEMTPSEISRKLGVSQSFVTQVKSRIAKRLKDSGILRGY